MMPARVQTDCSCAVAVVIVAPDAFDSLPSSADVREADTAARQARAAVLGAAVAVGAFAALFLTLVLLYVYRCTLLLHALHSLWIGSLIGGPLTGLLPRLCSAAGMPLDWPTLLLVVWK